MLGGENYRAGGQISKVWSFYQACVFMYMFVYTCTHSLGDLGTVAPFLRECLPGDFGNGKGF